MNNELRRKLCSKPIVDLEGNINHSYFLSTPGRYWSEDDETALLLGIRTYGAGDLISIRDQYLPTKSTIELKLQISLLLGVYNTEEYSDFRDTEAIQQVRETNLKLGKKQGKLEYGIYLNGDSQVPN